MPLMVNQKDQDWQYIAEWSNIDIESKVKFLRLAYLTGRNKYFELLGGNLNVI